MISRLVAHVQTDDLYLQAFHTTASELVEKALAMCEDIVMRLGRGQHYFRFIAAAYGLMRSRLIPQSTENEKRQATDRVANLFFKILYSQEDSLRGTSIGDGAGKVELLLCPFQAFAADILLPQPMGNGTPSSIGETSEPGISSPFAKDLEVRCSSLICAFSHISSFFEEFTLQMPRVEFG